MTPEQRAHLAQTLTNLRRLSACIRANGPAASLPDDITAQADRLADLLNNQIDCPEVEQSSFSFTNEVSPFGFR